MHSAFAFSIWSAVLLACRLNIRSEIRPVWESCYLGQHNSNRRAGILLRSDEKLVYRHPVVFRRTLSSILSEIRANKWIDQEICVKYKRNWTQLSSCTALSPSLFRTNQPCFLSPSSSFWHPSLSPLGLLRLPTRLVRITSRHRSTGPTSVKVSYRALFSPMVSFELVLQSYCLPAWSRSLCIHERP